jgi:hypothetical protein
MPCKAGFAEIDITPPVGTLKAGWLREIVSDKVIDPLLARVAVLRAESESIAFISLDILSIRWTQVADIRARISREYGFPGANVMVAATHSHSGPAIANVGDVPRDEGYIRTMVLKVVEVFGRALEGMQEAEIGFGSCFEFGVCRNRRVVMRDGTVVTHGTFDMPGALCLEGPIDPEVAVLAVRSTAGRPLGVLINFACHPTHHGPTGELSAGYPGALARQMQARSWPVAVFLNGACGNLHDSDPAGSGAGKSKEQIGAILAEDAQKAIRSAQFTGRVRLAARSRTIQLPYRQAGPDEVSGTIRGAQRFVDSRIYDRGMPGLLERISTRLTQPAEVQALLVNDCAFVGIPAEYFVQNGLRIKEACHPCHALVVGHANGMVGYVPHKEAFRRGGYETTFAASSRLAPEAGDMLADAAIELVAGKRCSPAAR